ncbi:MAG: phosphoethanolamine transferase [Xanthomonadales bacterium]|nr:phosphoethanolamine transferase [Xanthomonadales bacterium]
MSSSKTFSRSTLVQIIGRSKLAVRPEISIELLALLSSIFFTIFSNTTFFHAVSKSGELHGFGGWLMAISLFVAIAALNTLLLCILLYRWTAKPVLIALLLITAAAAHYMSRYTVYFDTDMIRNILQTDTKEASELITPGFALSIVIYGVLPSIMVLRLRIRPRPFWRAVLIRTASIVAAVAVAAGAVMISFQGLSSLMRNHKEMRYLIAPGNYLVSLAQVGLDDGVAADKTRIPVGVDARAATRPADARPRLLVLVVGETVRAQNWGLNGYFRQTTPQLERIKHLNFKDVTACGTSTEVALPCMFSPYGRTDYDKDKIRRSESLLHVLERAGIKTLWRDNQSGCKGICDGLTFESFQHRKDAEICDGERCLDEVMLKGLSDVIGKNSSDMVVVLHQLGNHGPSYFKRYPQQFRKFTPDCRTAELGKCTQEQIVNAYDNAILYTDDFLAKTIALLSAQQSHDAAMLYVSDHGESLGESGLYLHGIPYAIAPSTQVKVPMAMWLSEPFVSNRELDMGCLFRRSELPASHDNYFHSVLGLMQVSTNAYDQKRDVFNGC